MSDSENKRNGEELADEALNAVAGGASAPGGSCELCGSTENVRQYFYVGSGNRPVASFLCANCIAGIERMKK